MEATAQSRKTEEIEGKRDESPGRSQFDRPPRAQSLTQREKILPVKMDETGGAGRLRSALSAVRRRILRPFQVPVSRMPMEKCIAKAMQTYGYWEGRTFDLAHPKLFTEKIVWYKLFYRHPDLLRIHDKYLFKDYILEKLGPGYTAPLYGVWTDMRSFKRDWDGLPDSFCLKSNCSYTSCNIRLIQEKKSVNKRALFREVRRWLNPMNTAINSSVRVYKDVTPRIMAEKLLSGEGGQLKDYKIYCFDGRPYIVGVISDRFISAEGGTFSYYDLAWNLLPVTKLGHTNAQTPKPRQLEEMLRLAARLSQGFPFMRVDLYLSEGRILVGELTPFSGNHFDWQELDREMGKRFILPMEEAQ